MTTLEGSPCRGGEAAISTGGRRRGSRSSRSTPPRMCAKTPACRLRAVHARRARQHVCGAALDDPAICGLLDRRGVERLLPAQSGGGAEGAVGRLRSGDAPGVMTATTARHGRCRQGGRRDRHGRGYEDPVRRHPLDAMSVSMTMNGAVIPVLAFFIVAAEEQGVHRSKLEGTIQNDILKEFMVRNPYIYPLSRACGSSRTSSPIPRPRCPSSTASRSAAITCRRRATQLQELAFTIADGMEYVKYGVASGLDIDKFAGRLSFFFAIGMNFFMEVAKLRAARVLWHRAMTQLGAKDDGPRCCARIARPRACR